MSEHQSLLGTLIKGSIAGAVGTVVLSTMMKRAPAWLKEAGVDLPRDTKKSGAGGGTYAARPVEKLAEKLANDVFDRRLDKKEKEVGGQALHWGYGLSWGAFYGIMRSRLPFPGVVQGTLLSGLMGITAATVIPSMKIAPPPGEIAVERRALQQSYIVLYAWTTALVYGLLTRKKK